MTQISVFQTIRTKYVGPTNTRGSKIKATISYGKVSVTVSLDNALNLDQNHIKAAKLIQERMKWTGKGYGNLIGGQNADGSYTWIMQESLHEVK